MFKMYDINTLGTVEKITTIEEMERRSAEYNREFCEMMFHESAGEHGMITVRA